MMHPPRRSSLPSILLFCLFLANLISFTSAIFTYQGCYTIDNILSLNNTWSFQSSGWCGNHYAVPENFAVFGMSGAQCYVGNSIPANQVDGSKCSMGCPGYGNESCGAVGFLTVYLSGVGTLSGNAATTIISSQTPSPTVSDTSVPSNTIYVTAGPQTTVIASPTNTNSSSGISGGAAAGIAIGILALIAIGAAVFFVVRRRRRDEYQRQYDPSNLSSSPGSLNRPFGTDQRLEPQMLQKRESVGSLADENDYSRKILRVINPDGS